MPNAPRLLSRSASSSTSKEQQDRTGLSSRRFVMPSTCMQALRSHATHAGAHTLARSLALAHSAAHSLRSHSALLE